MTATKALHPRQSLERIRRIRNFTVATAVVALVSLSPMLPSSADPLSSTPMLTTKGYIFENDNSTSGPDGDTQLGGGNQNVSAFAQNSRLTVRAQVENSGGDLSDATKLGLFYDRGDGSWSKVQSSPTVATTAAIAPQIAPLLMPPVLLVTTAQLLLMPVGLRGRVITTQPTAT